VSGQVMQLVQGEEGTDSIILCTLQVMQLVQGEEGTINTLTMQLVQGEEGIDSIILCTLQVMQLVQGGEGQYCTHYALHSLFTALTIHYTHYALHSLFTALTMHCTHYALHSLFTALTLPYRILLPLERGQPHLRPALDLRHPHRPTDISRAAHGKTHEIEGTGAARQIGGGHSVGRS
jgi:hypothetical protein